MLLVVTSEFYMRASYIVVGVSDNVVSPPYQHGILLQMGYNTVQDVMVTQASALYCILHRELPCTALTWTQ